MRLLWKCVHLHPAAPPQAPVSVSVSRTTSNSITFAWNYIPLPGERLDYDFTLYYKHGGMVQLINASIIARTDAMTYTYTLRGLRPDTTYEVHLITRNGVSDLDKVNEFLRTVTISSRTALDGKQLCYHGFAQQLFNASR